MSVATTFALATAAPLGSVIVPESVAPAVAWAFACLARKERHKSISIENSQRDDTQERPLEPLAFLLDMKGNLLHLILFVS